MEIKKTQGAIEAILFASGDPISVQRLAEILELDLTTLEKLLRELEERYNAPESGIRLLRLEDGVQLCSHPAYAQQVRAAMEIRRNMPLSPAALEVLSVVAYNQPVTKAFIEQVRGVDSTYTMHSLIEKELIVSCGKLDVPGKPTLYKTTEGFLRAFGISSLDDLPNVKEFSKDDPEQLAFNVLMPEDPQ